MSFLHFVVNPHHQQIFIFSQNIFFLSHNHYHVWYNTGKYIFILSFIMASNLICFFAVVFGMKLLLIFIYFKPFSSIFSYIYPFTVYLNAWNIYSSNSHYECTEFLCFAVLQSSLIVMCIYCGCNVHSLSVVETVHCTTYWVAKCIGHLKVCHTKYTFMQIWYLKHCKYSFDLIGLSMDPY